jgi:hypothetical protein
LRQDRDSVVMCGRQRCRLCGEDTSVYGGLGLGAGIGEQVLGCVGDLGHSDEPDDRGSTSPVVGDAQPTVERFPADQAVVR